MTPCTLPAWFSIPASTRDKRLDKKQSTKIQLTEKLCAGRSSIRPFNLTGYLEVDTKIIPVKENYRYSISGLTQGYEGCIFTNAFGKVRFHL
jgi:hypothetical protein